MKAMLLAAGLGRRMHPLTESTPKPLLQVGSKCLIEYQLEALAHAGICNVIINVNHHGSQLIEKLGDGTHYGANIRYSHEGRLIRGTGGGILQALPLLGDAPFLVMSSDIWTDYPFTSLLKFKDAIENHQCDAHIVLVDNPIYHSRGDFCLSDSGKVTLEGSRLTYGGIAVLHPRIFAGSALGSNFSLAPLLQRLIAKGTVTGEKYNGVWKNVGTPRQLQALKELFA